MIKIGEIVRQKAYRVGKTIHITINKPSRLAFTMSATEGEWEEIVALLPLTITENWVWSASSFDGGGLKVEMKPKPPRDPLPEIDEIKDKIADYDELKARLKILEDQQ